MELFVVGKIVGCFGIRGVLKIRPMTHSSQRLHLLKDVFIGQSPDAASAYAIDEVDEKNRSTMMKIRSVDSRTAAESLVGSFVFVEKKDLSRPPTGSYYIDDIIGATVVTEHGERVGTIVDVYKLPGQDHWVVERGEKEFLLPVVKEFIVSVDVPTKRVTVRLIEGLLDA